MVKRRVQEEESDYMPSDTEVQERTRTSRRAKDDAQKVLADLAEGLSDSEPEPPPRIHWRKRLAAAQKAAARKVGRKPGRKPGVKPKAPATEPARSAAPSASPPPMTQPPLLQPVQQPAVETKVKLPLQLPKPLPSPAKVALPSGQPYAVPTGPPPKLRPHHHEFLSEYCQHQLDVKAAAGKNAAAANDVQPLQAMRQLSLPVLVPQLEPQLSSPSDRAEEFEALIASVLNMEAVVPKLATHAGQNPSEGLKAPPPSPAASPQSSGVASSPLAVGADGGADAGEVVESADASEASAMSCGASFNAGLGHSSGSGLWRLPSNSALLSYASCMAA